MSVQETNFSGWDNVGDGVLARLRAARTEEAPLPMAASVDQNTASPHWPMWRGFLGQLREAVDTQGKHPTPDNLAWHAEVASTLQHMASGEFWRDEAGNMHLIDLAAAKKTAREYVQRYVPEASTEAPGEQTRVIVPVANSDGGTTGVIKDRPAFLHDPTFRGNEPTRAINSGVATTGASERTVAFDLKPRGEEVTHRLSAAAVNGALGVSDPNRTSTSVGEHGGVIGRGYPVEPGEKTFNFQALNHDGPGERTAIIPSPAGPGEMTQPIDVVGLNTLLNGGFDTGNMQQIRKV